MRKIIRNIIEHFGYKISRKPRNRKSLFGHNINREDFFSLFFSMISHQDFYFVQVGANDGKHGDPINTFIRQYKLHGMLIEPLPNVYKQLKNNYSQNDNLIFENVAIGDSAQNLLFYTFKDSFLQSLSAEDQPRCTGLASFNDEVFYRRAIQVLNKILPNENIDKSTIKKYTEKLHVKTVSLNQLFSEHQVEKIDLLQIDCQGSDFSILKSFDLDRYKPKIINFEYIHLSDTDVGLAIELLEKNNYKYFFFGNDICAYHL